MLKSSESLKALELEAQQAVRRVLGDVPIIGDIDIPAEPHIAGPDRGIDFVAHIQIQRQSWKIVCEVKSTGQPRIVREAALKLRAASAQFGSRVVPILVTPYLSNDARETCRELAVNYLDLEGNCRIAFDGIYIERESPSRPPVIKRELRSLFKPKSAQVLRVLLLHPNRTWKVTDLAQESDVSLGHISNVTSALIDREWGGRDENGFRLTRAATLLDNWRDNYEAPPGEVVRYYTLLHGKGFERAALQLVNETHGGVALASFSAAEWLAPYGRISNHYVYARREAMPLLRSILRAEPAVKGDNLVVTVLENDGVMRDAIEPHPGIRTTGIVQTYLDLAQAGERGKEAAEHLRTERLSWLS
ncbi:hypothetical protein C1D09_003410 [Mesorhizobium intechi]|uniref:type IV toxin-antitoxin system AbiEi family antitoxin n=1 Tax=Mesorhizobium intechi TaxID=537601 RepID=UPI000CBE2002|nr:type IV toxin-antitoxin system AbiEi family antitoxin [Mesorhizobium intechi]TSE13536.1 hypothetical protein C1D09_003410 [Mesorhizobium intechi]